ncbi:MAG: translation initiation factor IF-2 [Deltaproteobacteria bacterium]|nr:MAG: translation initiation factor IF-2 [Deltaproteobacteria bacterium]
MSNKDLIERVTREPGSTSSASRGGSSSGEPAAATTTKRVSNKVVRRRTRRKRPQKDDEVEASAAAASPEDESSSASSAAPEPSPAKPVKKDEPERSTPEPVAEEAPSPSAEPEAPPAEPVAAAPERPEPPVAAEPEVAEAPASEPAVSESPAVAKPEPAPTPKAPEPIAAESAAPATEEPKFVGLGSAVVKPPPGYDPTNPNAWRRKVEAEQAAAPPPPSRRRRVASGTGGQSRPGRSGRPGQVRGRAQLPGELLMRKRRRRTKRGGGGGNVTVEMKAEKRKVRIDNVISVGQLAHEMGLKATVVIRHLMELGTMATVNEMLDLDTATLIAAEFNYEVENVGFQEDKLLQHFDVDEDEGEGEPRPAVVTIMGHVDHGKTTLLDAIRKARVAQGEAGGITQHIGAYQVDRDGELITFLDTPGHAAFSAMRARGAQVTDIVILVVAADDGVQPQTVEAINHAKASEVPIIVAVNKMDKAGVSAEPIMQALSQYDLLPEDWGGETQFVPVSALKGDGIDDLLDSILVQSELLELSAAVDRPAEGVVIEAKVERGRGPVATVLIQRGTLKKGDNVVLGAAFGRVRAMVDHRGKRIKEAGPSAPVEIFGISDVPSVGDVVTVVKNEKDARTVADHRADQKREAQFRRHTRRTADDLFAAAAADETETLYIVLKGDVQGSVEALRGALEAIEVDGTDLRILHAGVGNITESDVNLVVANDGLLLGFNVRIDANARKVADEHGVNAELYTVIYDILDRVEGAMKGMLEPEYEEVRKGSVEVRALFKISRIGTIAGCYVLDGKVGRNNKVRVLRDNQEIWGGSISTLKRFKDDVREVSAGYECGIALDGFNDLAEGDIFEVFAMEQVEVT